MGGTILDMDTEIEQKGNKIQFLEDKIGRQGFKIVEKMNRLELNKWSKKDKCVRTMIRLNKTLNNKVTL